MTVPHVASPSQHDAIAAIPGALLVLAGPGAGKTYCLTERIGALIEQFGVEPARICAFTFTNKAAGEIAQRLEARLKDRADRIQGGTIHAFCASLLREFGSRVDLAPGFGIADAEYQLSVLRRIEGPRRWHGQTLTRFGAHRLRGDRLQHNDLALFVQYEAFLTARSVLDFDMLLIKTAELLDQADAARIIRARWDVILVDEFQDLSPVQYSVISALAHDHGHLFAVGDADQSIYSWAGADPGVFKRFMDEFSPARVHLEDNRRCPAAVMVPAQRLVAANTPLFADHVQPRAERGSIFPVTVVGFETEDDEAAWIIDDIGRDRAEHDYEWGEIALLYRKHEIGDRLEAALLGAGIPCRLASGRAITDDPIVAYVIAALRVIARPEDDVERDAFFAAALPGPLLDNARAQAQSENRDLRHQLNRMVTSLPRADADARRVRRALTDWRNLAAVASRYGTLGSLVQDLLSRRVGNIGSVLDSNHDAISDPASNPEVVALAARLRVARVRRRVIWMSRMGGVEIALKGMLAAIGITDVRLGGAPPQGAEQIGPTETPSLGVALGLFKAAQLLEMEGSEDTFKNFTAIDIETTGRDVSSAQVVDIAAVRVRDGRIAEAFESLVKPRWRIDAGAAATHGISEADVADAPYFEDMWPRWLAFCGEDVVVAHNGYMFDFRILTRMAAETDTPFKLRTYDTLPLARDLLPTSRKLGHLADAFGIPAEQAHRALGDARVLAQVVVKLHEAKATRGRKTALINVLDHLGIALALSPDDALCPEARLFRNLARVFALSRYSTGLESYEREQGDDATVPTVDEVIERLGGVELMAKIRREKTADERYPSAMLRLRRLIADLPDAPLEEQLSLFLERVALSRFDGEKPDPGRVNLLTLHSTKGLEFSRVYVVGVEDLQLPGGSPTNGPTADEVEEGRRLLYVGMTRTKDRLVMTYVATRGGKPTGGHRFLDEMGLLATSG
jgi:DNA helicase II / ATP-dependent DNA helicase PcrA